MAANRNRVDATSVLVADAASLNQTANTDALATPPAVLTPDLCVIGAGSGGLSVAAAAAALGVSVILIERHKMGGDCLNYGCVPSKALVAAARRAHEVRTAAKFGIAAHEPTVDFAAVQAHIRGVIDAIAPNDSVERFEALGVPVIQGTAKFVDTKTVVVGDQAALSTPAKMA